MSFIFGFLCVSSVRRLLWEVQNKRRKDQILITGITMKYLLLKIMNSTYTLRQLCFKTLAGEMKRLRNLERMIQFFFSRVSPSGKFANQNIFLEERLIRVFCPFNNTKFTIMKSQTFVYVVLLFTKFISERHYSINIAWKKNYWEQSFFFICDRKEIYWKSLPNFRKDRQSIARCEFDPFIPSLNMNKKFSLKVTLGKFAVTP